MTVKTHLVVSVAAAVIAALLVDEIRRSRAVL